jgi:hypothetical protein
MYSDMNYSVWRERSVIQDCLNELGLSKLACNAMNADGKTIDKYLTIITTEAAKRRQDGILDKLYFAGLIYG